MNKDYKPIIYWHKSSSGFQVLCGHVLSLIIRTRNLQEINKWKAAVTWAHCKLPSFMWACLPHTHTFRQTAQFLNVLKCCINIHTLIGPFTILLKFYFKRKAAARIMEVERFLSNIVGTSQSVLCTAGVGNLCQLKGHITLFAAFQGPPASSQLDEKQKKWVGQKLMELLKSLMNCSEIFGWRGVYKFICWWWWWWWWCRCRERLAWVVLISPQALLTLHCICPRVAAFRDNHMLVCSSDSTLGWFCSLSSFCGKVGLR